ncbi:BglG family transcription antiterminator [Intestinibacter bartlettii]|uniref:PRD domain-containing protein n=1 Tax=Intestinibacter bartlettii TaxID=261299 RepID=A0ABS6DT59_9FIRM|nr:PRD domain-containing protein [Intestinibacter bartlettii]MBU5335004.1 PRD domain-containing protein [Intestinibacter bartlettii]MDO5009519.1 PRD domain-containing protein [Intestinibacter bartlettii]
MSDYFNNDNRICKILQILEHKRSASLEYLEKKLNVSAKSIKNDIKELNEIFDGNALIQFKLGKYKLYVLEHKQFEKIKENLYLHDDFFNSPKKRMAYVMNRLMNDENPVLTEDLAFEMSIGRTTLVGDLKKIREALKKYKIKIVGKTNTGLKLQGEEIDIRLFILENLYEEIYKDHELDYDVKEELDKIFSDLKLEGSTRNQIIKFLTVLIDRVVNGNPIKELNEKYEDLIYTKQINVANDISDRIEKIFGIKIPDNERVFMTLPIVGMRTPMDIDRVKNLEITEDVIELVLDIIKLIKLEMDITITPGNLLDEFTYHISFMLNRLKYGIKIKNPVLDEIKEKYMVPYKLAELTKMLIEDRTKKKVSKDELGFLAVYFSVFISENSYEQNKLCSIAIICGTGKITARLIAAQLRKIVDIDTKLEMFSDSQVNKELLDQFDLVLSTIKFECDTVTPIIYLKEIFDENQLKNKIESVRYTEKLNIPMLQGMESLVLSLLDEEKFFILDSEKSYIENVDYMIDKLYDLSYVDEGFKERIHIRESKSTMVFDEYIALPHAINKGTDKIVFSIGVFSDDNKKQKDQKLKVIFLLAIPDIEEKDDDILVKIYDEIIAISKDKQAVENIAKVKNYRELLLYFIKQDNVFN